MKILRPFLLCACLMLVADISSYAEEVIVTINGIENNKGNIRINVFTSEEDFSNKKPHKILTFPKQKVSKDMMKVRISLPPGEYGVSLLDDENKNEKMDYNMMHMPKEGFGFSDYYHTGLTMPKYKSFRFKLENDTPKSVTVKMSYM